jgi:ribosomal protein S18 acetylase RimI-like enzyme
MILFDTYDVRDYHPDDAAALFVVAAAIEPLDAGQLVAWTEELEGRVENGARVWLLARGRRLAGYALVEPLPGLPGVYDLSGGVVPARRGRGLGGRLLAHVAAQAPAWARATALGPRRAAGRRGGRLPAAARLCYGARGVPAGASRPERPAVCARRVLVWPSSACRANRPSPSSAASMTRAFAGRPWSQPYTEAEVAATLARADDLLFATVDGQPVGVVWHERLPDGRGRVEPIGIAAGHQGRGTAAPCCWPRCIACAGRGLRRWRSVSGARTKSPCTCTKV